MMRLRPKPSFSAWRASHAFLTVMLAAGYQAAAPQSIGAVSADIVISQVYGGGGNSGAPYANDFIELFNRGTTTVSLAGWSVQYTSESCTGILVYAANLIVPWSGA